MRKTIFSLFLILLFPATVSSQRPRQLVGTHRSFQSQHDAADEYDLPYMVDAVMALEFIQRGDLVRIPDRGPGWMISTNTASFYPYPRLARVARPWVLRFIQNEGAIYEKAFPGSHIIVTSLLRTNQYQEELRRFNATAARGRSPHQTGSVLDIARDDGMTRSQIRWMRRRLVHLERCGWVEATEELDADAFHIFVYPSYGSQECP